MSEVSDIELELPVFEFSFDGVYEAAQRAVANLREARRLRSEDRIGDRHEAAQKVVASRGIARLLDEVAPPADGTSWNDFFELQSPEQPSA